MKKCMAVSGVLAIVLAWTGAVAVVSAQEAQALAPPIVAADKPTEDFLRRARAAMGLSLTEPIRTLSVEATRWRTSPPPGAQIGTPALVMSFPDRCAIHDGLTHVWSGEEFWQVPVPAKGTPPRARHNTARRCAVDALTFALQGFGRFPFRATYVGLWREHGLSGVAVDFRGPGDYRVVMVFDEATVQRIGLVEYSEMNGVPTARVSRFEQMTDATGGLRWPRVLRETIGQFALEQRVGKVEVNAPVDESAFRQQ